MFGFEQAKAGVAVPLTGEDVLSLWKSFQPDEDNHPPLLCEQMLVRGSDYFTLRLGAPATLAFEPELSWQSRWGSDMGLPH